MWKNKHNPNMAVSDCSPSGSPTNGFLHLSDQLVGKPAIDTPRHLQVEKWFRFFKTVLTFQWCQWDMGTFSSFLFLFGQAVGSQMPSTAPAALPTPTPPEDAQANGRGRLEPMVAGVFSLQNFLGKLELLSNIVLFFCLLHSLTRYFSMTYESVFALDIPSARLRRSNCPYEVG